MSKPANSLTDKIVAFRAAAFAPAAEALPDRLLICPWGKTETNKGTVVCNATTLAVLSANQLATKREKVALDFQHNTVPGCESYTGEPCKVAAYGVVECVDGQGIYLSSIEWTPEGKEHATGGHYPDISPAIKMNDKGEVIWVHSAGLVRQGEMDGLTLFDAADVVGAVLAQGIDTCSMSWASARELLNPILALVGLKITDTAGFDEMKATVKLGADKLEAGMKTPAAQAAAAAVTGVAEPVQAMSAADFRAQMATFAALQAERLDAMEKNLILREATAAGKVVPFTADEITGFTVSQFRTLCEKLPPTVSLTPRDGRPPASTTETFSAAERAVMAGLGITEATFKKGLQ